MKTIVFPEANNAFIKAAAEQLKTTCTPILLDDLETAVKMVANGEADAFLGGIDHSTRDIILAVRDHIGIAPDQYDEKAVAEFCEVLYTLQAHEVVGWLNSLQLRKVFLPDQLKDEAALIIEEQRFNR